MVIHFNNLSTKESVDNTFTFLQWIEKEREEDGFISRKSNVSIGKNPDENSYDNERKINYTK